MWLTRKILSLNKDKVDENKITASFENGILKISVPKEKLPEVDTKKYIQIN